MKALGPDLNTCTASESLIRSACGDMAGTDQGLILAHISKVIELAIQSQTRPFLVIQYGVYQGAYLCGSGFIMTLNQVVYRPSPHDSLMESLSLISGHTNSLVRICERINVDPEEIKTMRILSARVKSANVSEFDKIEISKDAKSLTFPQRCWAINPDMVQTALNHLANNTHPSDDVPMHHSVLFSTDIESSVLSAFGFLAPSFLIPNRTTFPLGSGKDIPKTFAYRQIALSEAIRDFQNIRRTKFITNNPDHLVKSLNERAIPNQNKTKVWNALTTYASIVEPQTTEASVLPTITGTNFSEF